MSEDVPRRQTKVLDSKRLRSFLLGGAAGLLAGILLAPRSGRELRGSIKERAGEARERSRESLFEAQERMQERISEAREGADHVPDADAPAQTAPSPTQRPYLRDVSREEEPAERSDELRKKVRKTRERLRQSLDPTRDDDGDHNLRPGP